MVRKLRQQLTSRNNKPRATPFAIVHGIGNVVVTCNAERAFKTSVRRYSNPPCIAAPNRTLKILIPMTVYHSGPPLLPFFAPLAVRTASPFSPCRLMLTAKLGINVSKSRNSNDGTRKKTARMPNVPTNSTLRGEKESTRVLHVCVSLLDCVRGRKKVDWSAPCRRTRGLDLWSKMLGTALAGSLLVEVIVARPWWNQIL